VQRTRKILTAVVVSGLAAVALAPAAGARPADKKADQVLAKTLVLRASDLPAGWAAKKATKDKSSSSTAAELNKFAKKCGSSKQSFDAFKKFETGKAKSDFASPNNSETSVDATIFKTKNNADKAWGLVNDCLLDGFIKYFDTYLQKSGGGSGATFTVGPAGAVDNSAVSVPGVAVKGRTQTITVSAQGQSIPLEFSFLFLHHGRADETVLLMSFNQELTPDVQHQLLETLATRIARA